MGAVSAEVSCVRSVAKTDIRQIEVTNSHSWMSQFQAPQHLTFSVLVHPGCDRSALLAFAEIWGQDGR